MEGPPQQRRLAAIMFSDICGYSRIMGADEEQALELVEKHNGIIQSGADQHGGTIIKKLGDGVLVEFSSAVNAVRCAIEVQRTIGERNASSTEKGRFQVRIGIHLGDVVVSEGDILGDGVNVASASSQSTLQSEPSVSPGNGCLPLISS